MFKATQALHGVRMGSDAPAFGEDISTTPDQIVFHVDMDCFYAACERLKDPDLEGKPVVVGMGYEDGETRGAVATASYEAREFGVDSAMPISEALEKAPRQKDAKYDPSISEEESAYYRSVDMDYYKDVGETVKSILRKYAETIREVSIDEAYLDVTEETTWEDAESYARKLKEEIEAEAGVPASIGVAPNMSAAKVASDYEKPDGLVVVKPGTVKEFLADLPIDELHGVGPVTEEELREMGVETTGDVAAVDTAVLEEKFGERGKELSVRARGEDTRVVEPMGLPKSISKESSLPTTTEMEVKREVIKQLSTQVAQRVEEKECLFQTVGIKVVEPPFEINTRAKSFSGPIADTGMIREYALQLLEEFTDEEVRKLGVRVSKLSFTNADQKSLTDWEATMEETVPDPVDEMRDENREVREQHRRERDGQKTLDTFF